MQKVFVGNTHRLKSAKILVVLIKKRDRKCGLTLTEAKILRKHMQSYENHNSTSYENPGFDNFLY